MPPYVRSASLAGVALITLAVPVSSAPPSHAPALPAPAGIGTPHPAESFRSTRGYQAVAAPTRLRIPALHVDSRLQPLGRQPDGTIEVPEDPHTAGWYADGPRPGQSGPAVILGHVDSHTGPGVFAELARAHTGTEVRIDRADGTTVTFRLTGISRVPKNDFPTNLVYAPTLDPALRLVTCGGGFDETRGSYRDNVIAFAE